MQKITMTAEEIKEKYGIDFVTGEAIRTIASGITLHMLETVMKGAYSIAIRDIRDASCVVHMAVDDGIIEATGYGFGPTHALAMQIEIPLIIEEWGAENLHPGDVIFCNDPFRGTFHQSDITMIRPIFWKDEKLPVFYLHVLAHLIDMGGPEAGGFHNGATEVYAEGLRVPPTLIYSKGVPVRSTFNLIVENTRTAQNNVGDIRALYGALVIGEQLLYAALERYGLETFRAGIQYSTGLTERQLRAEISAIPDGDYEGESYMDDDGIEIKPLKIKCTFRVRGDRAELDFSGTERQCLGNQKTPLLDLGRCLGGVKMALLPEGALIDNGLFRPIDVIAPPGSIMVALPPSSVSNHMDIGGCIISLVIDIINKAIPENAFGGGVATYYLPYYAGNDCRSGSSGAPWAIFDVPGGGWGAWNGGDGISGCCTNMVNCLMSSMEHIEAEAPVILWDMDWVIDSGGPGKYRGGIGAQFAREVLCDANLVLTGTQMSFFPKGAAGGGSGGACYSYYIKKDEDGSFPSENGITPADHITPLCGMFDDQKRPDPVNGRLDAGTKYLHAMWANEPLKPGMVYRGVVSGGGGYGDPLERDIAAVRKDVWNEYVSIKGAEQHYGVIIDPKTLNVDEDTTIHKRKELAEKRKKGEWKAPMGHHPNWLLKA